MDLDRTTTNQELYDPDSQVVRSTQTLEETSAATESEGDKAVTVASNLRASSIRKIGELVDQHPDEALTILRTWIYQES